MCQVLQCPKKQHVESMVAFGSVHVRLHDASDVVEYLSGIFRHGWFCSCFDLASSSSGPSTLLLKPLCEFLRAGAGWVPVMFPFTALR